MFYDKACINSNILLPAGLWAAFLLINRLFLLKAKGRGSTFFIVDRLMIKHFSKQRLMFSMRGVFMEYYDLDG